MPHEQLVGTAPFTTVDMRGAAASRRAAAARRPRRPSRRRKRGERDPLLLVAGIGASWRWRSRADRPLHRGVRPRLLDRRRRRHRDAAAVPLSAAQALAAVARRRIHAILVRAPHGAGHRGAAADHRALDPRASARSTQPSRSRRWRSSPAAGVVGRFLYSRIHHGLYGRRATLADLRAQAGSIPRRCAPSLRSRPRSRRSSTNSRGEARRPARTDSTHPLRFMALGWHAIVARRRCTREAPRALGERAAAEDWPERSSRAASAAAAR